MQRRWQWRMVSLTVPLIALLLVAACAQAPAASEGSAPASGQSAQGSDAESAAVGAAAVAQESAPVTATATVSAVATVTVTVTPTSPAPTGAGAALAYADAAQCSSLFDLNMARTSAAMEHDLFWTWHLNFKLRPASDPDTGFLGCLHFYWRHDAGLPFQAAENYILTPCTYVGVVNSLPITATGTLSSSFAARSLDAVSVTLEGGDHIECSLDLGAYGVAFAQTVELENEISNYPPVANGAVDSELMLQHVQDELNNLQLLAPQEYRSFSFGAVAALSELDPAEVVQPLVYYRPLTCPGSANCAPFALEHEFVDWPLGSMQGELASQHYSVDRNGDCLNANDGCFFASGRVINYHIMEYGWVKEDLPAPYACNARPEDEFPYLYFSARPMSSVVDAWDLWCPEDIIPFVYDEAPPDGLWTVPPYWTGPSMVYAGWNPDSGEYLSGDIYEMWLDPDGSGTHSVTDGGG